MKSEKEIKLRIQVEKVRAIPDPREARAISDLIRQVRIDILEWVLE